MKMNDPLQTLYQLMSGRQPAAVTVTLSLTVCVGSVLMSYLSLEIYCVCRVRYIVSVSVCVCGWVAVCFGFELQAFISEA